MFHSTWAYSQDSKHPGFANYSCSQNVMFDEIIGTTEMVMDAYHFDILIPCGTAIQNARTSTIGDSMTRDGYHLNYASEDIRLPALGLNPFFNAQSPAILILRKA